MNIVKYDEYEYDKKMFFRKHYNDFQCETRGSSAEYYIKTYTFVDNAVWYEIMQKKIVEQELEINYCHIKVDIELLETEYWNSDNSDSKYYYEPWIIKT